MLEWILICWCSCLLGITEWIYLRLSQFAGPNRVFKTLEGNFIPILLAVRSQRAWTAEQYVLCEVPLLLILRPHLLRNVGGLLGHKGRDLGGRDTSHVWLSSWYLAWLGLSAGNTGMTLILTLMLSLLLNLDLRLLKSRYVAPNVQVLSWWPFSYHLYKVVLTLSPVLTL